MVLCDCRHSLPWTETIVASIYDDRARGGLVQISPHGGSYTLEHNANRNRRGADSAPVKIACEGCNRHIQITFLTAGDVVDRLAGSKNLLGVVQYPPDEAHALLGAGWHSLVSETWGDRDFFAIPFSTLCAVVTRLSKSRSSGPER